MTDHYLVLQQQQGLWEGMVESWNAAHGDQRVKPHIPAARPVKGHRDASPRHAPVDLNNDIRRGPVQRRWPGDLANFPRGRYIARRSGRWPNIQGARRRLLSAALEVEPGASLQQDCSKRLVWTRRRRRCPPTRSSWRRAQASPRERPSTRSSQPSTSYSDPGDSCRSSRADKGQAISRREGILADRGDRRRTSETGTRRICRQGGLQTDRRRQTAACVIVARGDLVYKRSTGPVPCRQRTHPAGHLDVQRRQEFGRISLQEQRHAWRC